PIKDRLYVHYFTFTVTEPLSSPMIIVDTTYPDAVSDREGEIYEVVVLNIAETYISKPNINFINEMTYKGTDLFNARGIVRTLHELTNPQTKQELDYKTPPTLYWGTEYLQSWYQKIIDKEPIKMVWGGDST